MAENIQKANRQKDDSGCSKNDFEKVTSVLFS